MSEVLVVNPSKKPKRRMSALQRMYFGKKGVRKNPANPAGWYKQKTSPASRTAYSRPTRRNPSKLSGAPRRYRRNPDGGMLVRTLFPTMIGAGGAIVTDVVMGFLPLPAMFKTGVMRPVVKGAAAFGIGLLAGMVAGKRIGNQVMAGALTVVAYDSLKTFLQKAMPALPLGQTEEYPMLEFAGNGDDGMGAFIDDGMGELVDESSVDGMGTYIDNDLGELVDESTVGSY